MERISRKSFVEQIELACSSLGLEIDWLSDGWVADIRGARKGTKIVGYTFELNNSAAAELATDKVCAFQALDRLGVPAVPHVIHSSQDVRFPLVIKPHRGDNGLDVLRAGNREEFDAALRSLTAKYRAVTCSPYIEAGCEYRVIVLDGRPLLIFRKRQSGTGEWRFNLNLGAEAELISEETGLLARLSDLARRAADGIGIRFGAIDILESGEGLIVVEVNDAFSLVRFSMFSRRHFELAADVYVHALRAVFDTAP